MAEQNNNPAPQTTNGNGNGGRRRALLTLTGVFLAVGAAYGAYYGLVQRWRETTDDAYVSGNLVYVNAQVAGTVVGIGADDTQSVKAGQTLVKLDRADTEVALADAEAKLAETVRQIRQQYRSVDQYAAVVDQRRTELARAQDDLQRRQHLADSDAIAAEDVSHARAAAATAKDALTVAEKQLVFARTAVDGTTLSEHPSVRRARAAFEQAYLAAQRNEIPSPIDGYIAKRSVQVGQRVTPGSSLMAVVPLQGLWVDANLKESQLRNVRIGQPATVSADLYGSHVEYHGKVVGIAAGTGGAFSLLPPQNATGNWIKVVQRVPVRIALDAKDLAAHPLRVGLSTDVQIDTHQRDGSVLSALPLSNSPMATPVFDAQLKAAQQKADLIIAREAKEGTHA